MERVKQFFVGTAIIVGLILFFGSFGGGTETVPEPVVNCETISVPHEYVEVEDITREIGDDYTDLGQDGEREVCTNESNEIVSDEILVEPVTETIHIGIVEPEPEYDYYDEPSGGAICNDGWRSYSTGSGTCSWHGGVAYWL